MLANAEALVALNGNLPCTTKNPKNNLHLSNIGSKFEMSLTSERSDNILKHNTLGHADVSSVYLRFFDVDDSDPSVLLFINSLGMSSTKEFVNPTAQGAEGLYNYTSNKSSFISERRLNYVS